MSYTRPSTIIARILRQLGLKQGQDFRVRGEYRGRGADRERIGTYVAILSKDADQTVADHADEIEQLSASAGNSFRVSIHFTAGGRMWTWVANYGQRTRDAAPDTRTAPASDSAHPAADIRKAVKDIEQRPGRTAAPVIVGQAPSPSTRKDAVDAADGRTYLKPGTKARSNAADAMPKLKLGAARPAFEQPKDAHPYEGLAQKPFGSLTWACEEARQTWFFQNTRNAPRYTLRAYRGRARVVGWYLSGPGIGQPGSDRYMGATVTIAATAAQDVILEHARNTRRMEEAATQWPKGTRVSFVHKGVTVQATVTGDNWGVVTDTDHTNYGRTWAAVDLDPTASTPWKQSYRPFTDSLTRI